MADKTVASSIFRLTFHQIDQEVVVTRDGVAVGRWVPSSVSNGPAAPGVPVARWAAEFNDPAPRPADHGEVGPPLDVVGPQPGASDRGGRPPPVGDGSTVAHRSIRPAPKPRRRGSAT